MGQMQQEGKHGGGKKLLISSTNIYLSYQLFLIYFIFLRPFSVLRYAEYASKALLGISLTPGLMQEGNPLALHFVMFLPTIIGQGTSAQQTKWLDRALNLEILGAYAQVINGIGTNRAVLSHSKMFF